MDANPWSAMLAANAVLLVLLAMAYPATEPGSGSRVVAKLSLLVIVTNVAGIALVLRSGWRPFEDR